MRRATRVALLAVLVAVAPATAAAPDFAALTLEPYEPPKPAPAFALPDLDGRTARLEDYRGRVVLLFFWTTYWPDCRKELPSVVRLATELAPRGLDAVLVSYREDAGHVRQVARERGYTARVLVDATGDTTGRVYGVFGTPTVYVIDREGRLVARGVGPRDWESPAARRLLEALVGAPGGR